MAEITLSLSKALLSCHFGLSGVAPLLKPTTVPEDTWKLALETVITFHGNEIFTNVKDYVPQINEGFNHGTFLRPVFAVIFEGGVNIGRVMVMIDYCAMYCIHLISHGKALECEIVENELFLALMTYVNPWLNGREWKEALVKTRNQPINNNNWSWWNILFKLK